MGKYLDRLLEKLTCSHEWECVSHYEWRGNSIYRTSWTDTYVCKKCGKFKKIKY